MRLVELLEAVRVTVPVNPFTPVMLMLVELLDPVMTVRLGCVGLMLKSIPATATVVEAKRASSRRCKAAMVVFGTAGN